MVRHLTGNQHIDKTIGQAWQGMSLIKRFCAELSGDVYTARILYLSLARPLVEYASVVWSPRTLVHLIAKG